MRLKANIEIVTGFLGAGKTTFINTLLDETLVEDERVVVILCESGDNKVEKRFQDSKQVTIKECNFQNPLSSEFLQELINFHRPHRIIIEHNGSVNIGELFTLLNESELLKLCKVTSVFHITDAITFKMYIENMGNILLDSIYNSDLIIVNNTAKVSRSNAEYIINTLEKMNNRAFIIELPNIPLMGTIIKEKNILHNGMAKKINVSLRNLIFK